MLPLDLLGCTRSSCSSAPGRNLGMDSPWCFWLCVDGCVLFKIGSGVRSV